MTPAGPGVRLAGLALVLWCAPSSAQPQAPSSESAPAQAEPEICGPVRDEPGPTPVDFRAGRVELDGDLSTLSLSEGVEICVARYRLRSDRLRLKRGPRGVETEGPGEVAFCPCPDPPVKLGFSSALVAPPTDLIVKDPTLYVGGVPVMYLPVLWLRSPDRLGLLPPVVAWRGDDGLFAGAGMHAPLGADVRMDLRAGGYFRGGADVDATLATETTTTRVSWDHLEDSVTEVEASGYAEAAPAGGLAFRADVARGARARRGIIALVPAAQRVDRAEAEVQGQVSGLAVGFGFGGSTLRGTDYDQPWQYGPSAYSAVHGALGEIGGASLDARASTLSHLGQTSTLVLQRLRLVAAHSAGPFAAALSVTQGAFNEQRENDAQRALWLGARGEIGLPLRRSFGSEQALQHRVEPHALGWVRTARVTGLGALPAHERNAAGLFGIRTRLGSWRQGTGLSATARAGAIALESGAETWAGARMLADFEYLGAGLDAASGAAPEDTAAVLAQLRLGSVRAWSLSAHVEGTQAGGSEARYVASDDIEQLPFSRLVGVGWSSGGRGTLAWTRWLSTAVSTHYDLSNRTLLAVGGGAAYRHPCDCLALVADGAQRIGRGGVDVSVRLDLMP